MLQSALIQDEEDPIAGVQNEKVIKPKSGIYIIVKNFLIRSFIISNKAVYLHLFYKESKINMKQDLHPKNYRLVVFKDMSNEYSFITKSCIDTRETVKWEDGNEYPLVKLEISHTSHPFYTGKMKLVDTAGRIDKFRSRYNKK
jgi:large subunit ribosomal protein L31